LVHCVKKNLAALAAVKRRRFSRHRKKVGTGTEKKLEMVFKSIVSPANQSLVSNESAVEIYDATIASATVPAHA
jgi:hypothetical protein